MSGMRWAVNMDKKASVPWRIMWILITIITALVVIAVVAILFYSSTHGTSPFDFFRGIFGGI